MDRVHEFMKQKVEEAAITLRVWETLKQMGLEPPILQYVSYEHEVAPHVLWTEITDTPWERLAQITGQLPMLRQVTTTYWGRKWSVEKFKVRGVPDDKWQDAGYTVVAVNAGIASAITWSIVDVEYLKIVLKAPLAQMGVSARVMPGGIFAFDLDGWEKAVEPSDQTYFYKPEKARCPECGAEPGYHFMTCGKAVVEPVRVSIGG